MHDRDASRRQLQSMLVSEHHQLDFRRKQCELFAGNPEMQREVIYQTMRVHALEDAIEAIEHEVS